LDVAKCIHKGDNLLRLVQLDDLSDWVYVLYASAAPKPPDPGTEDADMSIDEITFQDIPLDIQMAEVGVTWQ